MAPPPYLEMRPGGAQLVGPIDLSNINEGTLPTILQRLCDEIQSLKDAFGKAETKRAEDQAKILEAIEASKISNTKTVLEFSNDADIDDISYGSVCCVLLLT